MDGIKNSRVKLGKQLKVVMNKDCLEKTSP